MRCICSGCHLVSFILKWNNNSLQKFYHFKLQGVLYLCSRKWKHLRFGSLLVSALQFSTWSSTCRFISRWREPSLLPRRWRRKSTSFIKSWQKSKDAKAYKCCDWVYKLRHEHVLMISSGMSELVRSLGSLKFTYMNSMQHMIGTMWMVMVVLNIYFWDICQKHELHITWSSPDTTSRRINPGQKNVQTLCSLLPSASGFGVRFGYINTF